jgi:hypothetical protein
MQFWVYIIILVSIAYFVKQLIDPIQNYHIKYKLIQIHTMWFPNILSQTTKAWTIQNMLYIIAMIFYSQKIDIKYSWMSDWFYTCKLVKQIIMHIHWY